MKNDFAGPEEVANTKTQRPIGLRCGLVHIIDFFNVPADASDLISEVSSLADNVPEVGRVSC